MIGAGKNGPPGKYERWLSSASSGSVGLAMITDRVRTWSFVLTPYNFSGRYRFSNYNLARIMKFMVLCPARQPSKFGVEARSSLVDMSSSSSEEGDIFDEHCFRSLYNKRLFEETVSKKEIIPKVGFNCDEEYPEVKE
ncbi:hypothetical protein PIB30_034034 [Stylosanthes scabra]|uniref:Uncharacterized protein n=1 Tax=Stylosanthes scabra TaxID=79078 RepID=A0ABU6XCT7_9FABA|nr:hypothetical protein [Stylosanthes scabra]